MSTMGVEEEFLLVDPTGFHTVPRGKAVLRRAREALSAAALNSVTLHEELASSQVEAATGVCSSLAELRAELVAGRAVVAQAARAEGVAAVSAGTAALPGKVGRSLNAGDRYAAIGRLYADVADTYEVSGCHVHIGVSDRETAVAVINHLRPWLPMLLALSANSPFADGRDTGYASWRMMHQAHFPGSGVPPRFASADEEQRAVERLVDCGVVVDSAMSFWLARPSSRFSTVEVRAADAVPTVDDAVLLAALTRGLVQTALAELETGREGPELDDQVCAAAVWSAARYGMDGPAVHPVQERSVPASDLARELLRFVSPALEETGDLPYVRQLWANLMREGTGARRQRLAAEADGGARAERGSRADGGTEEDGGTGMNGSTGTGGGVKAGDVGRLNSAARPNDLGQPVHGAEASESALRTFGFGRSDIPAGAIVGRSVAASDPARAGLAGAASDAGWADGPATGGDVAAARAGVRGGDAAAARAGVGGGDAAAARAGGRGDVPSGRAGGYGGDVASGPGGDRRGGGAANDDSRVGSGVMRGEGAARAAVAYLARVLESEGGSDA
ncbi:carboxylate-amine ligase [Actinomadura gamaensis]|uniref:Putative glutamate--cysteine ligase 2 n=1 Tax=Actinomadura gamaensis TaxID=1763541 RepID=A0ABV9TVH9_9ACTN